MKTTERFDNAITKLYNAFHKGKLCAMICTACAVGNICDNSGAWGYLGIFYSTDKRPDKYKLAKNVIKKTGYSAKELQIVEKIFLKACNYTSGNREQHFKGLCAVIEYLCELDNIPNVMDYTKLFETENDNPKYQLS